MVSVLALLATASLCLALAGCGRKGEPTGEVDGYVYVPMARGTTAELMVRPEAYTPSEREPALLLPVEGARISIAGTQTETTTNAQGYFRISGLRAGKYTMLVKYGELAPLILIIEVVGGHVTHCVSAASVTSEAPGEPEEGGWTAIVATDSFRRLVLAEEAEPGSGVVIAALASGLDLHSGVTEVAVPDEAASVIVARHARTKSLLEGWNRMVLAARSETGVAEPVERAVTVLRDQHGREIMRVETIPNK